MKPIGQKIVKLMLDMNFEANPIIIHVFSNGGAYLYQHIDLAIKEYQIPLDVSQVGMPANLKVSMNCPVTLPFVLFRFVASFSIQRPATGGCCRCTARCPQFTAKGSVSSALSRGV